MSREDIVAVAVRLFAVFLAVTAVRFAYYALTAPDLRTDGLAVALLFTAIFPLVAATFLWVFPLSLSHKLLPAMRTPTTPLTFESQPLMEVGCTILGLWLLAVAFSDALYWSTYLYASSRQGAFHTPSPDDMGAIIATLGELVIGLWVLFGYRGIVGAIRRFRTTGVQG
jgi:hypothetical protein